MILDQIYIETPIGNLLAKVNEHGLCYLKFNNNDSVLHPSAFLSDNEILKQTKLEINEYFNGTLQNFTIHLNSELTEFQHQARRVIKEIPYGHTTSYKALAKEYGDENAVRAIANANAKNPILIIVPCHRVIGSNGSLTGYAGGIERKEFLLNHERKIAKLDYQEKLF